MGDAFVLGSKRSRLLPDVCNCSVSLNASDSESVLEEGGSLPAETCPSPFCFLLRLRYLKVIYRNARLSNSIFCSFVYIETIRLISLLIQSLSRGYH